MEKFAQDLNRNEGFVGRKLSNNIDSSLLKRDPVHAFGIDQNIGIKRQSHRRSISIIEFIPVPTTYVNDRLAAQPVQQCRMGGVATTRIRWDGRNARNRPAVAGHHVALPLSHLS
jgi:hypothetical protein